MKAKIEITELWYTSDVNQWTVEIEKPCKFRDGKKGNTCVIHISSSQHFYAKGVALRAAKLNAKKLGATEFEIKYVKG